MSGMANVEKDVKHALPRSGRALCLLLFALAWFQLSYASHQFEHVAGDLTGACVVCTQMERLDAAALHESAEAPAGAVAPAAVTGRDGIVPAVPVRRYESRAPPVT